MKKNIITFRLDDEMLMLLQSNAHKSGLKMSAYLRHQLMHKPIIKVYNAKPLLRSLSKIGNNINQIARHTNFTGNVSENDLRSLQAQFFSLQSQVYHFIGKADSLCQ